MSDTADPRPPRRPAARPDATDDIERPNQPIGPREDNDHPVDVPPEEQARREDDPRSRDKL